MAAGDGNKSQVRVELHHDTDVASDKVVWSSRTQGVTYESASRFYNDGELVGKKLHEYINAGAEAGTTTDTSALTSVAKAVIRNVGSYPVSVVAWTQVGQAAAGNIVIAAPGGALDTIGHATTDMDASPQFAKAGDYVHLSSAAEDAGNQDTYHLISAVAAAAATDQIDLATISGITANADDDTVVLTFLHENRLIVPAGGLVVLSDLWVAKSVVCSGRGGASEVRIALLEV